METCDDFKCAHPMLRDPAINALAYVILAGIKDDEGVIISRDLDGMANERWLDSSKGIWYIA